jgi:hypothetical protein
MSAAEIICLAESPLTAKIVLSSLVRSHVSGKISVGSDPREAVFRVLREGVVEQGLAGNSDASSRWKYWFEMLSKICLDANQWAVFVDSAGMALRNIDHLFLAAIEGPYPPPTVDFLWARVHDDPRSGPRDLAAPGFWAVRGEHAEMVLGRLKAAWEAEPGATEADETQIWSQVVRDLPLRKRAFERGEVLCPPVGSVDWKALCSAAFVTVPHWPEPERWKFLQSLYFGTYFGDETGLLVNLFDP